MYSNLIFSQFFQTNMTGNAFNKQSGLNMDVLSDAAETGFNDFLRKFQEGTFEFMEVAGMEKSSGISSILDSQDSKEQVIGIMVEKMKEALRQVSDNSSFVSFSSVEVTYFRKVMVSLANFSGSEGEMEELLDGIENSSGAYLPEMLKSLENMKDSKEDMGNIFFPFSFIPYFETALESINVESANIKSSIENSIDIDNGFSLKDFISSLKQLKEKAEFVNEKLTGSALEQSVEKIKGIEIIISVFEISKTDTSEGLSIDKKAFENFIAAMDSKRAGRKDSPEINMEFLKGFAGKKEAAFVTSMTDRFMNGGLVEESFSAWKRRERVLKENESAKIAEDVSFKHFERSHEYKFFTKILSVEMDLKNYFSDTGDITEKLNGNIDFEDIFKEFSDGEFDLSEVMDSEGFERVLAKNSKKNSAIKEIDEVSDFSGKNTYEKVSSGEVSSSVRESRANLQKHVIEQIEKQILRTVRIGAKELSFRLNPPDLGKMHLKLESVRNGLNIKIIAEKSSTHELLLHKSHEFKQQLQTQGMDVVEVNVELASDFDQAMARERKQNSKDENKARGIVSQKRGRSGDISGENLKDRARFVRSSSDSNLDLRV